MESSVKIYATEELFQADCFQWHWNTYPQYRQTLFHVQQKAKNRIEGARFKAIGVVKGISDLILILPSCVVFIELKLPKGTQSEEQITFQRKVSGLGYTYRIVRTLEEFKLLIKSLNLIHYGSK